MKLPRGGLAIVEFEKLTDCCLNPEHPRGKRKARVFAAVGIRLADAGLLREALLPAAREADAVEGEPSPYGRRYLVDFAWGMSGPSVRIRSAWIVANPGGPPRLTSCYVL